MKKKIKTYSLEELKNKYIGKRGTKRRELYETELSLDLLGEAVRQTRIKKKLTQEQLGQLIGVQKSQISKIENNFRDTRINTLIRVFDALNTKIRISIES